MAKGLNASSDLLFIINSKVKNVDEEPIRNQKRGNNHLKRGGKMVVDPEDKKPFSHLFMHVCGKSKIVEEKLEAMSTSIFNKDWEKLDSLFSELKELKIKLSKKCSSVFIQEQIKTSIEYGFSIADLEILLQKFQENNFLDETAHRIGVSEALKDWNKMERLRRKKKIKIK